MSSSHSEHEHSRFIQHHFDGPQHQFDSGKLGIWLFLVTEVLFFSGLFVAYIVYRTHHPEIFAYANHYLDTELGAINTGVLILSSLSAAWAVRCAQLNQQRGLMICLVITIVCAFGFLGIKYVEYSAKFDHGTLWGAKFDPHVAPDGSHLGDHAPEGGEAGAHGGDAPASEGESAEGEGAHGAAAETGADAEGAEAEGAHGDGAAAEGAHGDGASDAHAEAGAAHAAEHAKPSGPPPANTAMFFSIYFGMTGLHGIHVTAGIFVFIWLLIRASKGHFTPDYYGPVDYAALYWHLVDLIWIYLFPLLYLIH